MDLGTVRAVTLRVSGIRGWICDIRVSCRWTGRRILREVAQTTGSRAEAHQLLVDGKYLIADDVCLDKVLPESVTSADASIVFSGNHSSPAALCAPEPVVPLGIERLVHV